MFRSLAVTSLLGLALTTPLSANVLKLKKVIIKGDCDPDLVEAYLTDEDNLNVLFADMTVISGGEDYRNCRIRVKVKVPDGYKIAAESMTLDGEFSVGYHSKDKVSLEATYGMENYGDEMVWSRETGDGMDQPDFSHGESGSFQMQSNIDRPVYAPCGKDVYFEGAVHIRADGHQSYLSLDQSVAQWNWGLKRCRDHRDEYTIKCESRKKKYKRCKTEGSIKHKNVKVRKRLSKAACKKGHSWGKGYDHIWVDKGCRAIFEIK